MHVQSSGEWVPDRGTPRPETETRFAGMGASALLHVCLTAALWWMPPGQVAERKPVLEELLPRRAKLVWYPLTPRLPEITPSQPKPSPRAAGTIKSGGQVRMALPPAPELGTQYVLQPSEKRLIDDIAAPNLVAIAAQRKAPKQFVGVPANKAAPARMVMNLEEASAPLVSAGLPAEAKLLFGQSARPVKKFEGVPGEQAPPSANQAELTLEGAPAVAAAGIGQSSADAVILGLNPAPQLGPIPEGSRNAQVAIAPQLGEPGAGPGGSGGLQLPNVAIREGRNGTGGASGTPANMNGRLVSTRASTPAGNTSPAMSVFVVRGTGAAGQALSVPLRPSSRTIPLALEAVFRNRVVYTLVVPKPELPQYSGDWILWFAETHPDPGVTPAVRAPAPFRKTDTAVNLKDPPPPLAEGRVQLMAVIRRDGRLANVTVLRCPDSRLREPAPKDLVKWEFQPATRNGQPLDVDVVIEIPFRL